MLKMISLVRYRGDFKPITMAQLIEVKRKKKVPVYGGMIIIVMTNEEDCYEPAIRHWHHKNSYLKGCDAVCLSNDSGNSRDYPVIFTNKITPGIIAHEAKHIVNKIYKDLDIVLDRSNDEPECYLLSYIVNRIWEVYLEFVKKQGDNKK